MQYGMHNMAYECQIPGRSCKGDSAAGSLTLEQLGGEGLDSAHEHI